MRPVRIFFTCVLLGLLVPLTSHAATGVVLDAHKYAWSDRSGYINFGDVLVGDTLLSGYAWSANHGWIKFNPAQGGVFNNGEGNLSGFAWGEQLGWIDFDNVLIDDNGRFSGTASNDLVGTITFDCPNYCDVRTDWRPATQPPSEGGAQSSGNRPAPLSPVEQTSEFIPPVPPGFQTIIQDTPSGEVILSVPRTAFFDTLTFTVTTDAVVSDGSGYFVTLNIELVGGVFFNVTARDQNGVLVHFFPSPIAITLPIPGNLYAVKKLGVYWLNDTNHEWVLIPDAVFSETSVTFEVNHLTTFAIFAIPQGEESASVLPALEGGTTTSPYNTQASQKMVWLTVLLAILLAIYISEYQKHTKV